MPSTLDLFWLQVLGRVAAGRGNGGTPTPLAMSAEVAADRRDPSVAIISSTVGDMPSIIIGEGTSGCLDRDAFGPALDGALDVPDELVRFEDFLATVGRFGVEAATAAAPSLDTAVAGVGVVGVDTAGRGDVTGGLGVCIND